MPVWTYLWPRQSCGSLPPAIKYLTINKMKHSTKIVQFALVALVGIFLGWVLFHQPKPKDKPQQEAKKEIWTCSMHPQIRMDKPGKCPICGMDLIPLVTDGGSTLDSTALY